MTATGFTSDWTSARAVVMSTSVTNRSQLADKPGDNTGTGTISSGLRSNLATVVIMSLYVVCSGGQ